MENGYISNNVYKLEIFKNIDFKDFSLDSSVTMNEGNDNRILKIKNKIIPMGFKNRI